MIGDGDDGAAHNSGARQLLRWGLTALDVSRNTLRGSAAAVCLRAIISRNPLLRLRTGGNGQVRTTPATLTSTLISTVFSKQHCGVALVIASLG
eukprot:COSAG05_NODE_3641_length_1938_cov_227.523654_2_plen_94_part_00